MNSYKNIIKSTGLIGVVQVSLILLGLIRNKALALLVGSKGFGIWGLYHSYVEMMTQIAVFGLDQSGVRQIAKNSENTVFINKCIFIFRWAILTISVLSTTLSIIFSKIISKSLFGSFDYSWGVVIVSFAILFNSVSKGQKSILNGLRDIKGLAVSQIIGAVVGTIASIIFIYLLGVKGIPFYLFSVGLATVTSTWWFVQRLNLKKEIPTLIEAKSELKDLFSLGLGFGIAGIVATLMTYISRVYLINTFNVETVGIYQSAWSISNLYVGIILSAMGIDLMPRLMMVVKNSKEMVKMVNEQMELGLLIGSIGVVIILVFSPWILELLFSAEFIKGTTIIRWQAIGVSLRVLAFPLSYIIMAKGKTAIYIVVQSIFWIVEFLLLVLFSKLFGFDGLGINYFVGYMLYLLISWYVSVKLIGFKPSSLLKEIIIVAYIFIMSSFIISFLLSDFYRMLFGTAIILTNMIWINFTFKNKIKINLIKVINNKLCSK